jgi:hypothetical protein
MKSVDCNHVMLLNSFNNLADEFFEKMTKSFPQEGKIRGYHAAFRTARKYNNKKPVEMFMTNLIPFGYQIIHKEESFFKKDEYVDHVQSLSGKMGLLQYWETMPKQSQIAIWEYMQSLYMLGMNIFGLQEDLKKIMNAKKDNTVYDSK